MNESIEKPSKIVCEKCGAEEVGIVWPVSHSYNVRGVDSYGFVQIDFAFTDEDHREPDPDKGEGCGGMVKLKVGRKPIIVCLGGCGADYEAPKWMRFRVILERSETVEPI